MRGVRLSQQWRCVVGQACGARRAPVVSCRPVTKLENAAYGSSYAAVSSAPRAGNSVAPRALPNAPPAPPQAGSIRSVQGWEQFIEILQAGVVGVQSKYAAIRKLAELTRSSMSEYRALAREGKILLTHGIDTVLTSMADDVKQLSVNEQQVLLLDVSHLGAIFTGPDWRQHCPDVPVDLLNKLFDSVVSSVKSLKGSQVAMVLFSLHKLQLRDPRAFAHICDCVLEQLNSPGRNSWYNNTDALSKLVAGVTMCAVSTPANVRDDQFHRIVSTILSKIATLDEEQFNASGTPWQDVCMALDAVARLPPTHNHVYASFVTPLLDMFVEAAPEVPTWCSAQVVRAASMPGVHHAGALALVTKAVNEVTSSPAAMADNEAALVVDALEAHARMPKPDVATVKSIAQRVCGSGVPAELRAQVGAIEQRLGCLGDKEWDAIVSGGKWGAGGGDVPFSSRADTECEAVLNIALARADVAIAKRAVEMALAWSAAGVLKLWRVVPYLEALARAPRVNEEVRDLKVTCLDAQAPGKMEALKELKGRGIDPFADDPTEELYALMNHGFDWLVPTLSQLANPTIFIQNRALEICHAIAACIKAGRRKDVESLLNDENRPVWFVDLCGEQQGLMLVLTALADDHFLEPGMVPRDDKVTQAASLVLAEALAIRTPMRVDSRPLVCAALALCRCRVDPSEWAIQLAQALDHSPPTTHLEMLQAVTESRWFQATADDTMKDELERFLPAPEATDEGSEVRAYAVGVINAADPDDALGDDVAPAAAPAPVPAEAAIPPVVPPAAAAPAPAAAAPAINFAAMTAAQLKEQCRERGLKVGGKKAELVDRLAAAEAAEAATATPVEDTLADVTKGPLDADIAAEEAALADVPDEELLEDELDDDDDDDDELDDPVGSSLDDLDDIKAVLLKEEPSADDKSRLLDALAEYREQMPEEVVMDIEEVCAEELSEEMEEQLPAAVAAAEGGAGAVDAFAELKVAELKDLLKANKLKVGGKKQELVERLVANGVAPPPV